MNFNVVILSRFSEGCAFEITKRPIGEIIGSRTNMNNTQI